MMGCLIFFALIIYVSSIEILPFSRLKINNDQIYFTLSFPSQKWYRLLSIDSFGSDAIIKYSKDNYGINMCDFEIECYKYNIIKNFNKIYSAMQNGKLLSDKIGLEYEFDNQVQNELDVECTKEKYDRNEKMLEENIKLSKVNSLNIDSLIVKGLNKLKKTFVNYFNDDTVKIEKGSKDEQNLRSEIVEIKNKMKDIKEEEDKIEEVSNIIFKIIIRIY
jgi:hypothetical protein